MGAKGVSIWISKERMPGSWAEENLKVPQARLCPKLETPGPWLREVKSRQVRLWALHRVLWGKTIPIPRPLQSPMCTQRTEAAGLA